MPNDAPHDTSQVLDTELHRRLFAERILVLGDALQQDNATRLCSSLLLLATEDPTSDIALLINSPGGSVPGMLAIRDCMRSVSNDVATVNLGMAYSAGQFLLSSGTPGKRFAMPHAKVLLHQGSGGLGGSAPDIAIQAEDIQQTRDIVLTCIAEDTGQPLDKVEEDSRRDRWFTADQAREYGFLDHVVDSVDQVVPRRTRSFGVGGR